MRYKEYVRYDETFGIVPNVEHIVISIMEERGKHRTNYLCDVRVT